MFPSIYHINKSPGRYQLNHYSPPAKVVGNQAVNEPPVATFHLYIHKPPATSSIRCTIDHGPRVLPSAAGSIPSTGSPHFARLVSFIGLNYFAQTYLPSASVCVCVSKNRCRAARFQWHKTCSFRDHQAPRMVLPGTSRGFRPTSASRNESAMGESRLDVNRAS